MARRKFSSNRVTEVSTVFGITLLLVLLGVFAYFMITAHQKSKEIKEQLSVDILFQDEASEADVLQMEKELASRPYVKQAQYISKDSAKSLLLQHVGDDAFDILDGANPIPSSINVNLSAEYVNPDSAAAFSERIMKEKEHLVSEVSYSEAQFLEVGSVFKNFEMILLVIAGILLIISIILINITIRLAVYSKRFIIRTMQLVGASSSFIRRPFLIRAFFHGFVSGMLAIIILIGLWHLFSNFNPDQVSKMSINEQELNAQLQLFGLLFSGVLGTGIIISIFSTYFALNKYIWINSEKLY
tara:strand:- start:352 stop:1251 length:900 start_codon:yes stop_codon:yes gene_type:complete